MRVVHVVCSDSFAGVERYVTLVAPRLARRGMDVTVVGGEAAAMAATAAQVDWRPAAAPVGAARTLISLGHVDIVHAHMTEAEVAAAVTRPVHRGRLVTTRHFAAPRGRPLVRGPLRLLAGVIDEELAISEFVASATGARRILRPGVEASEAGPEERERVVLVLQRLEPEKDTALALRAWARCGLRSRGWRLRIAGRGGGEAALRSLTASLGIEDSVDWSGFITDAPAALARAAVLLAPAPAEPLGLTVLEAMARATPVVAADGGAHRETVGEEAGLFAPGDAAACARALEAAAGSDGGALRERQRRLFDIEDHVDRLTGVYRELVG